MGTIRITVRTMTFRDPPPAARDPRESPPRAETDPQRVRQPLPWSSEQLFAGHTEIEITHGPFVYRLRKTSLGKLILTK